MSALGDAIPAGLTHGTAVFCPARSAGVLLLGVSGSGKSDLALRLIDRGWQLIGDDQLLLSAKEGAVRAAVPDPLRNLIALPGLGICRQETINGGAPLTHIVHLDAKSPRFPLDQGRQSVCGIALPFIAIDGLAASAALRIERFVESGRQ